MILELGLWVLRCWQEWVEELNMSFNEIKWHAVKDFELGHLST